MKKIILLLSISSILSCKSKGYNETHLIVIDSTSFVNKKQKKITEIANCYDYLTELIRSSDFPFSNIKRENVSILIDDDNGEIIRTKLFFKTEGTGTIGWVEYHIKERKLLNISADLESPKELKFNNDYAIQFENCLNPSIKVDTSISPNSIEKFYQKLNLLQLPNKYTFEFITDEKDFTNVPKSLYSLFGFKNLTNYKMIKLPLYNAIKPIFLILYDETGQSKLYLITLNTSYNIMDKIKLYDNEQDFKESIATTYEITKNYIIKIKKSKIQDLQNKVIEKGISVTDFIINEDGKILQK